MMIRRAWAPGVLLVLAGCATIGAAPQNSAKVPEQSTRATPAVETVSTQSGATGPKEPLLARALSHAGDSGTRGFLQALQELYRNDPAVQGDRMRSAALGNESRALSNPLRPELSLNGATYGTGATLRLAQPLIDFGKRKARIGVVAAQQGLAQQDLADVRDGLLRDALDAMLDARFAQDRIALHRRQIADFKEARRAAERLVSLELLTSAELRLVEVEAQKAAIELARAEMDRQRAQQSWSQLFGPRPLPMQFDPVRLRAAAGIADTARAVAAAGQYNLDLRRHQMDMASLSAKALQIRRRNTPTINAALEVGAREAHREVVGGLAITYPIFNRDRNSDLARAEADIAASRSEQAATARELQFKLRQHAMTATHARSLAVQQRQAMQLLEQRINDVTFQVENGLATYPDVIDARADFFATWFDLLGNENDARRAEAEIILLSGVLIPQSGAY